jgi:hypothetical protein
MLLQLCLQRRQETPLMNGYYLYRKAWRFEGAPHKEPKLEKKEWQSLLKQGGLLVRNTYNFDQSAESSFWYIIQDSFNGLDGFSSNERNKIRRSNKTLFFKRISIDLLKSEGWSILKATYEDYAVSDRAMNETVFLDYFSECEKQDFDYWGIFDQDRFIGFCTVWLWLPDSCEYGLIGILPEYKHNNTYPYYGLFYNMNAYYLGEKGFRYVTDGARSITEHSHIQDFLIQNFNFRKAYCRLAIHYQWWMKIAVNLLYPFRKILTLPRIKAILNMEAMQRGEK